MSPIYTTKDEDGNIIKYEDEKGNILAKYEEEKIFNSGRLTITKKGIELGYWLVQGKIKLK